MELMTKQEYDRIMHVVNTAETRTVEVVRVIMDDLRQEIILEYLESESKRLQE